MVLKNNLGVAQYSSKFELVRVDALPEEMIKRGSFKDEGCDVVEACLTCPLIICIEEPEWKENQKRVRAASMFALFRLGIDVELIAKKFNVRRRTVYRETMELRSS